MSNLFILLIKNKLKYEETLTLSNISMNNFDIICKILMFVCVTS
jgi:hypothetical protein